MFMLLFIFGIIFLWACADVKKPIGYPPGPNWLPCIGVLPLIKQLHKRYKFFHLACQHLAQKFGPVVGLRVGRDRLILVSGLAAIKEFYTLDEFSGRPDGFFYKMRSFNERLGVVFNDGETWEAQRRFSVKILKQLGMGRQIMASHIEREALEMVEFFSNVCDSRQAIDMHNGFDVSTFNVIWALLAGERFTLNDDKLHRILHLIHENFRVLDMSGGVLNQFPFIRFIMPTLSGYRPLMNILTPLWSFLQAKIQDIKKTLCHEEPKSYIEAYLQNMLENENVLSHTFNEKQLLSLCLDLFQAGSETTSNTLGFSLIYMLHNPEIQAKVRSEIEAATKCSRLPLLQDRPHLTYTQAVLCEVQRMSNVAPLAIIHKSMDNVTLCGHKIPVNTMALVSLYSVHMDKGYWKDPEVFRPERFLDDNGNVVQHDYFFPFGLGKRRCIGENLAKSSLLLLFATFIYSFEMHLPAGQRMPDKIGLDGITLSPKPFKVILTRRNVNNNNNNNNDLFK